MQQPDSETGIRHRPGARLWVFAIAASLAVGVASVYPYVYISGPAHIIGNSAAIWLLIAFFIGTAAGSPARGAAAGTAALIAMVLGFYAGVHVLYPADDLRSVVVFWLGAALVGGAVFGWCGDWWRSDSARAEGVTAAVVGATFLAEAWFFFRQDGGWVDLVLEALAGAVLTFFLARGRRQRIIALCTLPVLFGAGLAGWKLVQLFQVSWFG
jgi:hypothetical protein